MTPAPALLGALLVVLQGSPSPTIRIDSREQGRTFFVDPDHPEIRKALRDVSAPSPAGPMPEWVTPPPDVTPWGQRSENAPVDFGVATYTSTTPPDALFAYFESRARATSGVTITSITRQPGRGGAFHAEDSGRTAVVSVNPGVRAAADFSINWRPKVINPVVIPRSSRLFAVWYDDTKQILRLRDSTTSKEYELGMATMLRYARSVALEPSARGDFPPWLAFYPGAKVIAAHAPPPGWQPQTGADMRSFNIELTTTASVAEVGAFYREAFTSTGLTILTESQSQERSQYLEARSSDRMHRVTVNIRRGTKDTHVRLMDHYTLPRP
jgi:hypothetical protein